MRKEVLIMKEKGKDERNWNFKNDRGERNSQTIISYFRESFIVKSENQLRIESDVKSS